ncbi:MAG TPA: hypothetical protein VKL40_14975 [Candidatus Angelobacter sp.]|nr:hypothetical protein [Candidatus Angelobacter sp.]
MMRANENETLKAPFSPAAQQAGKVCQGTRASSHAALIILVLVLLTFSFPLNAQTKVTLSSAPGGVVLGGTNTAATAGFGTVNALAIGTPTAGLTVIALNNGALYFTPYNLTIQLNGNNSHTATVTALITTNFTHPAALVLESCPNNLSCNGAGQYSALSTVTPTTVASVVGEVTVTAGLGIFVPDNDGAGAFTGSDSARITLTMIDNNSGKTATATIDVSVTSLQTSVQLTLGTAPGGLTISPAADYSANFGNVNGLGIGPGAGLSTLSVAGGSVYHTPYLLNPVFSDFSSTTATLKVSVSTNFAHPAILALEDASSSGGPYSVIPNSPTTLTITTTAANRGSITRHLGLFVSNVNGPAAFTGSDSATLTFTMTVP